MIRVPVIIDTNVLVSGLLTNDVRSPVSALVDGMLNVAFRFVVSEALLVEYRAVLARPRLAKVHGLSATELDNLLTDLAQRAIVLEPRTGPPAPEPGDQHLWDLLATRADLMLVTGDNLLIADRSMKGRILTPAAFLSQLGSERT